MKTLFTLLALFYFALPTYSQTDNLPSKKILISINSNYYKNAGQVVTGMLKQAKIYNFYIDQKLENMPTLNFQFKDKTIDQSMEILSKIYNLTIESNEKKDFYTIVLKEKK